MAAPLTRFEVGHLYSNDDISSSLGVGNAGGIRPHLTADGIVRRLVLMTALPKARVAVENPYHDRVEGDVLIYTGAGLQGDQEPAGLNRRLAEQAQARFPVWCFRQEFSRRDKRTGKNRWRYLGLLMLLRYYQEQQVDFAGSPRSVWVFEFGIVPEPASIAADDDSAITAELFTQTVFGAGLDRTPVAAEASTGNIDGQVLERLRGRMLALDPKEFEFLIRSMLVASGYESVVVTRFSQDGGIDVNAAFGPSGWPVRSCRVQVQAKRWLHTVGRKEVAELRGSLGWDGVGCLITTSHFSKAAVAEALEAGKGRSPSSMVGNSLNCSHRSTLPRSLTSNLLYNRLNYYLRLHNKKLPGKPDIVLARHKKLVFIHGCFWHRHGVCRTLSIPKNNSDFWARKFEDNVRRDCAKIAAVRDAGWGVLIIWECETKDRDKLEQTLRAFMKEGDKVATGQAGKGVSRKRNDK